jgi:hypothetical protein
VALLVVGTHKEENVTAEPIARVVADVRRGRTRSKIHDPAVDGEAAARAKRDQPVVDATAIYRSLAAKDAEIDLYGDHPCIAPPWDDAMVCYLNEHGNAIVMQISAQPWPPGKAWETPNEVAWDDLRWRLDVFVWVGGKDGTGREVATTGPVHLFQYAVMPDGAPADLHYVHLMPAYPLEHWTMAQLTLLASLNFLACKNVEIVEPKRPFPVRRRLAKTGVSVQTITVRSVVRRTRSIPGSDTPAEMVPLTSVRGHFAEYGPQYGKGLLFGKLSGRYWIPGHARGAGEPAEAAKDYLLKPSRKDAA